MYEEDTNFPKGVKVGDVIAALKKYDPELPLIIGAEGVFQDSPELIEVRESKYLDAKSLVLWSYN
jgi:hypothetical protein